LHHFEFFLRFKDQPGNPASSTASLKRGLSTIAENEDLKSRNLTATPENANLKSRNLVDDSPPQDVDLLTPSISKYQPQIIRETLQRDAIMQVKR
jgi:hypothetical protein